MTITPCQTVFVWRGGGGRRLRFQGYLRKFTSKEKGYVRKLFGRGEFDESPEIPTSQNLLNPLRGLKKNPRLSPTYKKKSFSAACRSQRGRPKASPSRSSGLLMKLAPSPVSPGLAADGKPFPRCVPTSTPGFADPLFGSRFCCCRVCCLGPGTLRIFLVLVWCCLICIDAMSWAWFRQFLGKSGQNTCYVPKGW